jgi:hypothetical protein
MLRIDAGANVAPMTHEHPIWYGPVVQFPRRSVSAEMSPVPDDVPVPKLSAISPNPQPASAIRLWDIALVESLLKGLPNNERSKTEKVRALHAWKNGFGLNIQNWPVSGLPPNSFTAFLTPENPQSSPPMIRERGTQ